MFGSSQAITSRSGCQNNGLSNKRGSARDDAEPLDQGHNAVRGGAHVVGGDLAHVGIEGARGRADAQEEGNLDEDDQEGRCPVEKSEWVVRRREEDCRMRLAARALWRVGHEQKQGAKDDDEEVEGEDVCDAERETE